MLIAIVVIASLVTIAITLGIDIGLQIWAEKRSERRAWEARQTESLNLLRHSITKRFERRMEADAATIELKVVELPKKPTGGRHRLTAA